MRAEPGRFSEFRTGWPLVLAATLGVMFGAAPIPFYTIGLFAPELSKAFDWGFGQIQFGVLISSVATLCAVPFVGLLADRFGARRVALASLVLFGLGFMSFALQAGSLAQFYATWAIMGALGAGTLPITWTRPINLRFDRAKGLALGICLAGTGLFGMFFKPVAAAWIDMFGWRGAYVAVALLPILVAFPVAWVFFREEGPHPDRAARKAAAADAPGLTLAQTLRDWRFWLLCVALFVTAFAVGGPTPNMENILGSQGFAKGQVVTLTPLIGASVIVGRLVSGFLMDRVWAPLVAFVLLCLPAGACLLLGAPGLTYGGAFAAIGLIGVAAGMESDLVAFLVARYFGLKSYGAVYGLIYVCYAMGGAVAAGAFGWAYDRAGSYQGVLAVSAALLVMGAGAMLTLGRYRYAAARAAEAKGAA